MDTHSDHIHAQCETETKTECSDRLCQPQDTRLWDRLGDEELKMSQEKVYDPLDATLTFINKPDDINPFQDEGPRAKMSCGHAVTPESLTGWCRSLLDQGQTTFRCPALTQGGACGAEWSYPEIRRLAALTVKEMQDFEERLALLAASLFYDIKACPGCGTVVERRTLDNLCFSCPVCVGNNKPTTEFCWQCLKPWKGRAPRTRRCANRGCVNLDLAVLRTCGTVVLSDVEGVEPCPSIRACPTCGMKVEHDGTGCKNVLCPRCRLEFCFVCLKLTRQCLQTSSYFIACSSGMAPRQTAIPKWRQASPPS